MSLRRGGDTSSPGFQTAVPANVGRRSRVRAVRAGGLARTGRLLAWGQRPRATDLLGRLHSGSRNERIGPDRRMCSEFSDSAQSNVARGSLCPWRRESAAEGPDRFPIGLRRTCIATPDRSHSYRISERCWNRIEVPTRCGSQARRFCLAIGGRICRARHCSRIRSRSAQTG